MKSTTWSAFPGCPARRRGCSATASTGTGSTCRASLPWAGHRPAWMMVVISRSRRRGARLSSLLLGSLRRPCVSRISPTINLAALGHVTARVVRRVKHSSSWCPGLRHMDHQTAGRKVIGCSWRERVLERSISVSLIALLVELLHRQVQGSIVHVPMVLLLKYGGVDVPHVICVHCIAVVPPGVIGGGTVGICEEGR